MLGASSGSGGVNVGAATNFQSTQGLAGKTITVEVGEAAIVSFRTNVHWDRGGLSVQVFPGVGGTLAYEHSLEPSGDRWTADRESPFSEPAEITERARVTRLRITPNGAAGVAVVLSPVDMLVEGI